jgi:hypothetical protein
MPRASLPLANWLDPPGLAPAGVTAGGFAALGVGLVALAATVVVVVVPFGVDSVLIVKALCGAVGVTGAAGATTASAKVAVLPHLAGQGQLNLSVHRPIVAWRYVSGNSVFWAELTITDALATVSPVRLFN